MLSLNYRNYNTKLKKNPLLFHDFKKLINYVNIDSWLK